MLNRGGAVAGRDGRGGFALRPLRLSSFTLRLNLLLNRSGAEARRNGRGDFTLRPLRLPSFTLRLNDAHSYRNAFTGFARADRIV